MVKDDDDLPVVSTRNKKMLLTPANLAPLSVHELEAYIVELETEIARVKNDIKAKAAQRSTAEALFKS